MRRFFRILRAVFAGVSLLLCVAAAGVWVRSYFVADIFSRQRSGLMNFVGHVSLYRPHESWHVEVLRGRIGMIHYDGDPPPPEDEDARAWWHRPDFPHESRLRPSRVEADRWDVSLPGLAYVGTTGRPLTGWRLPDTGRLLVVHLAYPTALFALAPLAWLAGFRRRRRVARRARAGLCAKCGYDLRASPGRCPECGEKAMSKG